ncbi:MAG: acyl-CoA dehydrogenase family protein [Baekduiaceae bacterium]
MDLKDTPDQAAYRQRVRAWIEEHRHEAPELSSGLHAADPTAFRAWQGTLADAGLVGITWPKEFGGAGLGPIEQVIVSTELRRAGCPGIVDHIAVGNIGPTIFTYGTAEQQERYLGPLLHGDEGWCQLFSEPAAGSDLAGITTRAVAQDDGTWRVTGQKVWTTMAQFADYGMLLARTDPDVPKHRGLTMFLIDMRATGVTVRPLRQISGAAHFNEVFLDEVELPADAVLGPVDGGWGVAMTTLMFERLALLAAFEELGWSAEDFVEPIADLPAMGDAHVRQRIAGLTTELLSLRYSAYRTLTALSRGDVPGPEAGLGKIAIINAGVQASELIVDLLGPAAIDGRWGDLAMEMPGLRSGGGTEEILRTTVGDRVLGLPPEPRVDKDVPFSELTTGKAVAA